MTVKVVDASAIAAILFDEPAAKVVAPKLHRAILVGPTVLTYELVSVFLKKARRHPADHKVFETMLAMRVRFDIEERRVDPDGVAALAIETALSAYDASYLWLAHKLDVELVTLDRELAAVAGRLLPSRE